MEQAMNNVQAGQLFLLNSLSFEIRFRGVCVRVHDYTKLFQALLLRQTDLCSVHLVYCGRQYIPVATHA